jgi:hypothetical protein
MCITAVSGRWLGEGAGAHYGPASVLWVQHLVLSAQRRIPVWLPLVTPHHALQVLREHLVWGCQLTPTVPWAGTSPISGPVDVQEVSKPHPAWGL